MTYIQIDRNGLSTFERPGVGSPVVILPGVMADAYSWMPVVDQIQVLNPVIVVNRRGHAPSRNLGPDYSVTVEVDDVREIVAAMGEPVHLFGWSYGGLIAMEAAVAEVKIRSLIAYEPVSRPFAPEAINPIRDALLRDNPDRAVEIVNRNVSGFDRAYVDELRVSPACRSFVALLDRLAKS